MAPDHVGPEGPGCPDHRNTQRASQEVGSAPFDRNGITTSGASPFPQKFASAARLVRSRQPGRVYAPPLLCRESDINRVTCKRRWRYVIPCGPRNAWVGPGSASRGVSDVDRRLSQRPPSDHIATRRQGQRPSLLRTDSDGDPPGSSDGVGKSPDPTRTIRRRVIARCRCHGDSSSGIQLQSLRMAERKLPVADHPKCLFDTRTIAPVCPNVCETDHAVRIKNHGRRAIDVFGMDGV